MILESIHEFTSTLGRELFYNFYALMTSLASPSCSDYLLVGGELFNLKKIVRRLRITVMAPRFDVDYAEAYTPETAQQERISLTVVYERLTDTAQKNAVAKIIGALRIIEEEKPKE